MEGGVGKMFWRATYADGSMIEQPATQIPIEYNNIDTNNLQEFTLAGDYTSIGVNLKDGTILMNGKKISFEGFSKKKDYRLIYFTKESRYGTVFYTGLQSTINGKNMKRIIELSGEKVRILV
jgi:hypothetical protein